MKTVLGIFFSLLLSVLPAAAAVDFQPKASCCCAMEECCLQPAAENRAPIHDIPARVERGSADAVASLPPRVPVLAPPVSLADLPFPAPALLPGAAPLPLFQTYCSFLI